jgi:hypothetical protein
MNIPPAVVDAWSNICSNWWKDEERFYEEEYGVDEPSEIKTADLKDCNYKDMRVLDDFITVCFSLFFFVFVLFCLGVRLCSSDRS